MPKVSVIIPVYNHEQYLRRCLDSVSRQTLRDIEIICINDASPDRCGEILREHALKDGRVKLIEFEKNRGVSAARNAGIAAAKGQYVGFVDSDDYPELTFFEMLFNAAETSGAEIAKGNYRNCEAMVIDYSHNEMIRKAKTNFAFEFCSCVFSLEFLQTHRIKFLEELIDMEDPVFSFKAALRCHKIAIVNNAIINIFPHNSSATAGIPSFERVVSKFAGLENIIDLANANETMDRDSYGYVTALWFAVTLNNASKNRTIKCRSYIAKKTTIFYKKIVHKEKFLENCKQILRFLNDCFNDTSLEHFFYFYEDSKIFELTNVCKHISQQNSDLINKSTMLFNENKMLKSKILRDKIVKVSKNA